MKILAPMKRMVDQNVKCESRATSLETMVPWKCRAWSHIPDDEWATGRKARDEHEGSNSK